MLIKINLNLTETKMFAKIPNVFDLKQERVNDENSRVG